MPPARKHTPWRTVPLPPDWASEVRPRILARDPRCRLRTHCWGARSVEVDHGDLGPDDHSDANLRGVCARCHAHRTGQQGASAANERRPKRLRPRDGRHPGIQ
ncbi:hypothetical protein GCM10012284_24110 [Mangrovihabitans endophyticus]|uniref:HNH endonuclease n=1 Tax=Mangrovihabitans endophyticus TaxID=1751298 RepID=A0A8J3FN36_9ACTN|nr:hypothetical protein GCM10012284_24110 [Mangrovihabitans endophyticus]